MVPLPSLNPTEIKGELYPPECALFDLADFQELAHSGTIGPDDGGGHWSDGKSYDPATDPFSEASRPEWATHVAWFAK